MDYSVGFVILMGLAIVFIGLICIIAIVSLMSSIVRKAVKNDPAVTKAPVVTTSSSTVTPAMVAAVSAVIAEEMGTSVSAIRINSFKKI